MDPRRREHLIEQLSAYLDDELTATQRARVEAFLAEDAEARRLLAELRATAAALHGLPRAKASERVLEGIRTRMERQALLGDLPAAATIAPRPRAAAWRWLAAAAVIGLAFLTLYTVWPTVESDRPVFRMASADRDEAREHVQPSDKAAEVAPAGESAGAGAAPADQHGEDYAFEMSHPERDAAAGSLAKAKPEASVPAGQAPAAPVTVAPAQPQMPPAAAANRELQLFGREAGVPEAVARRQAAQPDQRLRGQPDAIQQPDPGNQVPAAAAAAPAGMAAASSQRIVLAREPAQPTVVALVELNTVDHAAQQRAVQQLREQFAFTQIRGAGTPVEWGYSAAGVAAVGGSGAPAGSFEWRAGDAAGVPDQAVSSDRDQTLQLARVVPGSAVAATLQRFRTQWPDARVRFVPATPGLRLPLEPAPDGPAHSAAGDAAAPASLWEKVATMPADQPPTERVRAQPTPMAGEMADEAEPSTALARRQRRSEASSRRVAIPNQAVVIASAPAERAVHDGASASNDHHRVGTTDADAAPRLEHFFADGQRDDARLWMLRPEGTTGERAAASAMSATRPAIPPGGSDPSNPSDAATETQPVDGDVPGMIVVYLRVAPASQPAVSEPATRPPAIAAPADTTAPIAAEPALSVPAGPAATAPAPSAATPAPAE